MGVTSGLPYDLAIFDFDGTIADTLPAVIDVFNDLSDEFGYRRGTEQELRLFMGRGLRELATCVGLPWQRLTDLAVRVREEMSRQMHLIKPCRGMVETLAKLRARDVRLGILTSNNRENVERFLAHHPELQFDFISGGSGLFDKHTLLQPLLATHGSLAGLLEAAEAADGGLSAGVKAKLAAAADYLEVAPAVVNVVRDLDLPSLDEVGAQLKPVTGVSRDQLQELSTEWNLGGAVKRLLGAFDAPR